MNLPEIVAYLLSHGANPNIDARVAVNGLPPINQGALHCAARKGNAWRATLTELLKSPHVDIDKKDSDGKQYSYAYLLYNNNNKHYLFTITL